MIGAKTMQWATYTARIEALPSLALRHIIKDATEALKVMLNNPNAGWYTNEIYICAGELHQRARRKIQRHEVAYHDTLTEMYRILKEAGYNSYELIDNLRELVNDSQRPATMQDEG